MRNKISLLAAVLFSCTSAFAQSNSDVLQGDVNRDGVVDVADVTAVIDVMQKGGGVTESGLS